MEAPRAYSARPYGRYELAVNEREPEMITYSRGLPSFGNPNQMPNPPQHYFPSIPASQRQRRVRSPGPDNAAAPPAPPKQARHEPTWNAAREFSRESPGAADGEEEKDELDDVEMDDANGDGDGESSAGGKDDSGSVPAKKRSRTLTTAHQTAVLNALLAKTRFPSTETREEVGQQIGMSARRVQIWFQNRRQSQKRARDRDVPDSNTSQYPLSPGPQHHPYLANDPYANSRYGHRSQMSNSSLPQTLTRQTSIESMSSVASYNSIIGRSAYDRHRVPVNGGPSYAPYPPPQSQHHWSQRVEEGPSRGYAFPGPAVPSKSDMGMHRERGFGGSPEPYGSPEPEMRLPSLSAVLGGAMSGAPPSRQVAAPPRPISRDSYNSTTAPRPLIFSHRPPSMDGQRPLHSDRTAAPPSPKTTVAPDPRFEGNELSLLWISNPNQQRQDSASPPGNSPKDVLDAAMETMHRASRVNPPRSSLPTLRTTFSSELRMPPIPQRALPASEADAALLAPILKQNNDSSSSFGGKPATRLPPISSLSLSSTSSQTSNSSNRTIQQQPLFANNNVNPSATSSNSSAPSGSRNPSIASPQSVRRGSSFSHASSSNGTNQTPARSSISSFDTLNTTWTLGPSIASSRTSFSSEVQEEWDRASAALGGGMSYARKGTVVVREGSWEAEHAMLKTPEEVQDIRNASSP